MVSLLSQTGGIGSRSTDSHDIFHLYCSSYLLATDDGDAIRYFDVMTHRSLCLPVGIIHADDESQRRQTC